MRRGIWLGAALGLLNASVVLLLARTLGRSGEFGWYAYSPMPARYSDLPGTQLTGWALAAVVIGVLVVVNVLATMGYWLLRRRRERSV